MKFLFILNTLLVFMLLLVVQGTAVAQQKRASTSSAYKDFTVAVNTYKAGPLEGMQAVDNLRKILKAYHDLPSTEKEQARQDLEKLGFDSSKSIINRMVDLQRPKKNIEKRAKEVTKEIQEQARQDLEKLEFDPPKSIKDRLITEDTRVQQEMKKTQEPTEKVKAVFETNIDELVNEFDQWRSSSSESFENQLSEKIDQLVSKLFSQELNDAIHEIDVMFSDVGTKMQKNPSFSAAYFRLGFVEGQDRARALLVFDYDLNKDPSIGALLDSVAVDCYSAISSVRRIMVDSLHSIVTESQKRRVAALKHMLLSKAWLESSHELKRQLEYTDWNVVMDDEHKKFLEDIKEKTVLLLGQLNSAVNSCASRLKLSKE